MKRIVIGFLLSLAVSFAAFGQWNPQKSNTTASLQGLSIVNANVVWASGTGGTFVRTTDAGQERRDLLPRANDWSEEV